MSLAEQDTTGLGGTLLASVSRSFYLSIRLLPAPLRAPIGLAYLLARASDTIADSAAAPPAVRLAHLAAFATMVRTGKPLGLPKLQREILPEHAGERELIAQLDGCLAWLTGLEAKDRGEVIDVLEKIIAGQTLDVERFGVGGGIVALQTAAELDEYTYLVAGCVGEFWTRLCLSHFPNSTTLGLAEMRRLGANFGKGLQLVNILRDLPADLRAGRCYLPETELRAAGTSPRPLAETPEKMRPVFNHWHAIALGHLRDAHEYIAALRSVRLRIACFLPYHLGLETLRLLAAPTALGSPTKIKVSRWTVRCALLLAVPVAFSNRALDRVAPRKV